MSFNTEEMLKYFESEEFEEKLNKSIQELNEKADRQREFELNKQDDVMFEVTKILKKDLRLDGDDLLYFPEKYNFTGEEFNFLFSNIKNYAEDNKFSFSDDVCDFQNQEWHCLFQKTKLIFKIMHGQGTARWIELATKEDWRFNRYFDYEVYKRIVSK